MSGLAPLLAGLGGGLGGYVQGEEAGVDIAQKKQGMQEESQKLAGTPLMMIQQQLKLDKTKFTDANTVQMYNRYAPALGLPAADPQKGIPEGFAQFDLPMILNPSVWVAKQAQLEGGALRDASQMLDTAIAHGADPMMAIQSGAAIIRQAGGDASAWLQGTANSPYYQNLATQWYGNKLDVTHANLALIGVKEGQISAATDKLKTLLPAEYNDLIQQTALRGAQTNLASTRASAINVQLQQKWAQIQQNAVKIQNDYLSKVNNYHLGLAKLSETQRHDKQAEINNILATQGRDVASMMQLMSQPGVDPTLKTQIMQALSGNAQTGQLGITDQMAGAYQQAQNTFQTADTQNPYMPAPGTKPGTKVVPKAIKYDPNKLMKITAGPFAGAYVQGKTVKAFQGGKWHTLTTSFTPESSNTFSEPH